MKLKIKLDWGGEVFLVPPGSVNVLLMIDFWNFSGPELTEIMKLNLANQITDPMELRSLATCGLRVKSFVINKSLTNVDDITNAALKVIDEWDANKPDKRAAYNELCEILRDLGRGNCINVLEDKKIKSVD